MERLLPSYVSYSSSWISYTLLEHCKRQVRSGVPITYYPYDAKKIYRGLWMRCVAMNLAEDWFLEHRKDKEFDECFLPLAEADCNSIILEAAAYEWLCLNPEESIRKKFPHVPNINPNLNQGLVLRYYEPIMRMCCFISGMTYREEREGMPSRITSHAHEFALRETITKMASIASKEDVVKAVEELQM